MLRQYHCLHGLIIFLLVFLASVLSSNEKYDQCIDSYFGTLGQVLNKHHVQILKAYYESTNKPIELPPTDNQVLIDIGMGSLTGHPLVFYHIMQLNIRGVHSLGRAEPGCTFQSYDPAVEWDPVDLLRRNDKHVYVNALHQPFGTTWLNIVKIYPQTRLLMNDIGDREWYNNQFTVECNASRTGPLTDKCFAPVLLRINRNAMKADFVRKLLLSNLKFEQAQILMRAYRTLISCLVPPDQLFAFNLQTINSTEYWTSLTQFLGRKVKPDKLAYLIEGNSTLYPPPMVNHEECRERPCYNYERRESVGPTPSVCEDTHKTPPPRIQHKFIRCATEYAGELRDIFGQRYHALILNRLLAAPSVIRYFPVDEDRIILGIGPGTTGTTSIYTAMKQLNVTSHHYNLCTVNCTSIGDSCRYNFEDDLDVLLTNPKDYPIFWGDSPVIGKWWHLLKMYPRTRLIMTDVRDDDAWYRKRSKEHCLRRIFKAWDSCVVPVAMEFRTGMSELSKELYRKVHFTNASQETSRRAFASYRKFVRCVVPPEQLLWVYIKEQKSSPDFWKMITRFANITVPPRVMEALVANGVPHCGKHGCKFNKVVAKYVGRENDSAIVPSVCALS